MQRVFFFVVALAITWGCGNRDKANSQPPSLDAALKTHPDSIPLLQKRANRSLDSMQYDLLLQDAAHAFRLDSNRLQSRLLYALALINKNPIMVSDFTGAEYHFSRVLMQDSTNLKAMVGIAGVYANLGSKDLAFKWLNKALRVNPRCRDAYVLKGTIYLREGKYNLAKSSYETAVQQDRSFFLGYMALGSIYQYEKNPLCIEYFTTACQLKPKNSESCYALAYAYELFNKVFEAKRYYRRMAKLDSTRCESFFHLAAIHQFNDKNLDSAMYWYGESLEINPNHIESLHNLGILYETKDDYSNALLTYAKVLKIDPNYKLTLDRVKALRKK